MTYADIIVDISHENLDRTYQYIVPPEWLKQAVIGALVIIPFGRGNREIKGYIVGISDEQKIKQIQLKKISKVVEEGLVIESHLLSLAYWMKEYYGVPYNDALKTVLPVRKKIKELKNQWIHLKKSKDECDQMLKSYEKRNSKAKIRLLTGILSETNDITVAQAKEKYHIEKKTVDDLKKDDVIDLISEKIQRNPMKKDILQSKLHELNPEQKHVVNKIVTDFERQIRKTYLLHGVTGSGKTEVYMEVISNVIKHGKQVIVLIPEISLTYQTVSRFYKRFGERVSFLNSKMSSGERYDQYMRAKNGEVDIMIGPRSALFTPFQNLGFIIIDEEHEGSYKSESSPRYHAREVARKRAEMLSCSVLLGSATPSLETYYKAETGEIELLTLDHRAGNGTIPNVSVVDLREEFKQKNRSIFSRQLKAMIEDRLQKKQQVMLFLNRRGYAGFISCRNCGHVLKCSHCDISFTAHKGYGEKVKKLVCHYCGCEERMPEVCPECGSPYIAAFGLGTQRVEEITKKEFPSARILRMDTDTTARKNSHENIIAAFANQEADILIGTQMIVKGHDFPNVTLVGILAADLSLHTNDFRSSERTFQLLMQAAGRAGRGDREGDVIIQSYSPEHYSIVSVKNHSYEEFYKKEIAFRKLMNYPPVSNIMAVLITSKEYEAAIDISNQASKIVKDYHVACIGPADATVVKINDIYRRVLYVKCSEYELLKEIKEQIECKLNNNIVSENYHLQFDINLFTNY